MIRMFESRTNEKGETLSQFEFKAICERWCEVFGELPPFGPPHETPKTEPDPLNPNDAYLRMSDMVRITALSQSTIKRRVKETESEALARGDIPIPKPAKVGRRSIRWRADHVKAWRRHIENAGSGRKH